jgi:hypothetical protein
LLSELKTKKSDVHIQESEFGTFYNSLRHQKSNKREAAIKGSNPYVLSLSQPYKIIKCTYQFFPSSA